jgi:hypothetical protein
MRSVATLAVAIAGIGVVAGTAALLGILEAPATPQATQVGAIPAGAVATTLGAAAPSTPGAVTPSAVAAATTASSVASAADLAGPEPMWTEVKWPFLLDQWGVGKAYECRAVDCGVKIDVNIRPKIGFCNCATGVSDDAELERVADTDLVSPKVRPLGRGRPVKVGWMYGLARPYLATDEDQKPQGRLLSIAFNDGCDAVTAVATVGDGDPAALEPAVEAFLNRRPVVLWVKKELGLEFVRRDW